MKQTKIAKLYTVQTNTETDPSEVSITVTTYTSLTDVNQLEKNCKRYWHTNHFKIHAETLTGW